MEDVTSTQLFHLNSAVTRLIGSATRLEVVLQSKLQTVSCQLEDCLQDSNE